MNFCQHCLTYPATRSRGLCYPCYKDLSIRCEYPSTSKYAPGSREQLETMAVCKLCGHYAGYYAKDRHRSGICSTCKRPPVMRELYHERIAILEVRAADGLPLFTERP